MLQRLGLKFVLGLWSRFRLSLCALSECALAQNHTPLGGMHAAINILGEKPLQLLARTTGLRAHRAGNHKPFGTTSESLEDAG